MVVNASSIRVRSDAPTASAVPVARLARSVVAEHDALEQVVGDEHAERGAGHGQTPVIAASERPPPDSERQAADAARDHEVHQRLGAHRGRDAEQRTGGERGPPAAAHPAVHGRRVGEVPHLDHAPQHQTERRASAPRSRGRRSSPASRAPPPRTRPTRSARRAGGRAPGPRTRRASRPSIGSSSTGAVAARAVQRIRGVEHRQGRHVHPVAADLVRVEERVQRALRDRQRAAQ